MLFALFYVVAIAILILHFTGYLARHNLEWPPAGNRPDWVAALIT